MFLFFFKQKTAYEMRISDWSSDVCSSDLPAHVADIDGRFRRTVIGAVGQRERLGIARGNRRRPDRLQRLRQCRLDRFGPAPQHHLQEIGRASCRERVCQYVYISVVAVSLKKKITMMNRLSNILNIA